MSRRPDRRAPQKRIWFAQIAPPRELLMPITPFLDGFECDAETKRVIGVAFEMARVSLGISNPSDRASEIIARRIIELAKAGERNPDLLCEGVLKQLREQPAQGLSSAHSRETGNPDT